MSVKQVQDKINALLEMNNLGTRQFSALLFAFPTSFDLDGLSKTLLIKWYASFHFSLIYAQEIISYFAFKRLMLVSEITDESPLVS